MEHATSGVTLPTSLTQWLDPLLLVFYVFLAAWLALWLYGYLKRRAYNLTPLESASGPGIRPDFLKVDHRARQQAIERGEALGAHDDAPKGRERPESGRLMRLLSRLGVLVCGLASLLTGSVGALLDVQQTQQAFYGLSNWDRWLAVAHQYWFGFTLAAAVIVVELIRFLVSVRGTPPAPSGG